MFSKSLAVGALAAGCVAGAAGGVYVAVRQNQSAPHPIAGLQPVVSAPLNPAVQSADAPRPVAETEAVVTRPEPAIPAPARATGRDAIPAEPPSVTARDNEMTRAGKPARSARQTAPSPQSRTEASAPPARAAAQEPVREPAPSTTSARQAREPGTEPPTAVPASVPADLPQPPPPQFEQLLVPASSVVGLRIETPLTTERSRLEDRVDARVTRDVIADGRVAIPAGARAIGTVMLVERGGKLKERARLGVRFHTLVLADGTELPISTEAIYREGESPSAESTRKIGGATVGGAILGAIIGGKKGAILGGATGAAGGTAVVMAGDRNAATLPLGTIVTIRLAAPVGVEVEKR